LGLSVTHISEQKNIILKRNKMNQEFFEEKYIKMIENLMKLMRNKQVTIYEFTEIVQSLEKISINSIQQTQAKNKITNQLTKIINRKNENQN
jgi:hypothetical protein